MREVHPGCLKERQQRDLQAQKQPSLRSLCTVSLERTLSHGAPIDGQFTIQSYEAPPSSSCAIIIIIFCAYVLSPVQSEWLIVFFFNAARNAFESTVGMPLKRK